VGGVPHGAAPVGAGPLRRVAPAGEDTTPLYLYPYCTVLYSTLHTVLYCIALLSTCKAMFTHSLQRVPPDAFRDSACSVPWCCPWCARGVQGPVNVARLEEALHRVMVRHPALRTQFVVRHGAATTRACR